MSHNFGRAAGSRKQKRVEPAGTGWDRQRGVAMPRGRPEPVGDIGPG